MGENVKDFQGGLLKKDTYSKRPFWSKSQSVREECKGTCG